jgi:signal recognition particle receptor subunit beta
MALVNNVKREINAKIVYFGPPGAGKTTCLAYIYRKLKAEYRSEQRSMALQQDRMMFFDFMPPGQGGSGEYDVRIHIYTLSGPVHEESSWKMLLKGVDGIVFVADASPDRLEANQQSMNQLQDLLAQYQRGVRDVPCLLQCNKSDEPAGLATDELTAALEWDGLPVMASAANNGAGVLEGLFRIVKTVMQELRANVFTREETDGREALMVQEHNATATTAMQGVDVTYPPVSRCSVIQQDITITAVQPAFISGSADLAVSLAGQPADRDGGGLAIPLRIHVGETSLDLELLLTVAVRHS